MQSDIHIVVVSQAAHMYVHECVSGLTFPRFGIHCEN